VSEGAAEEVRLRDGSTALVRPIEPADAPLLKAAYRELSERSRRLRFLVPTSELSDEDARYLTDVDHRRHEAMIALDPDRERAVGVARYVQVPGDRTAAEVAVVVMDDWHRRGLGTALLDRLTERARENGISCYTAVVSPDNEIVLKALERVGAERTGATDEDEIEFAFDLPAEGLGERLPGALRTAASMQFEFLAQALRRLPIWRRR
jgi:RimJ/RimL family protein N-acetyltransferase